VSIEWISVKSRLPDDRRKVLAWGSASMMGLNWNSGGFIGATKFNPGRDGGRFDIEAYSRFSVTIVTHWAEIVGPTEPVVEAPPSAP